MDKLLEISHLRVELNTPAGIVRGVRDVSLTVRPGEVHGIVGESGCGKTLTAKSILGLHDPDRTRVAGEILFHREEGPVDLLTLRNRELRRLRGGEIGMVFQDPLTTLNPLLTVGNQIGEMLRLHQGLSRGDALDRAAELLEEVGITPGGERLFQYPFEFSGGMLQRACIAMAISCGPKLLLADEPTTALDVTMQAQILALLRRLQRDRLMAVLLITHNFGVVAELCDSVSVMYAGQIVETGTVEEIFAAPRHPYTRDLIRSIPRAEGGGGRLAAIPGSPPDLRRELKGCAYAPRCRFATPRCLGEDLLQNTLSATHWAACREEAAQ